MKMWSSLICIHIKEHEFVWLFIHIHRCFYPDWFSLKPCVKNWFTSVTVFSWICITIPGIYSCFLSSMNISLWSQVSVYAHQFCEFIGNPYVYIFSWSYLIEFPEPLNYNFISFQTWSNLYMLLFFFHSSLWFSFLLINVCFKYLFITAMHTDQFLCMLTPPWPLKHLFFYRYTMISD